MADTPGRDPNPDTLDPQDPRFARLLAQALAAEQEEDRFARAAEPRQEDAANGDSLGSTDLVVEQAFHTLGEPCLEGDGTDAWATRLLADDDLRAHLVDLARARLDADATELPAHVREAALSAFDRSLVPLRLVAEEVPVARRDGRGRRTVRTEPLRVRGHRPVRGVRSWLAAAALVLVALGAGLYLAGGDQAAEAGLQLTALGRIDLSGSVRMSSVEPRYFARLGRVFTPAQDELLSFGFAPDARLVVGAGDAVRVTRSSLAERIAADLDAVEADGMVLRLESGEARLATAQGPILLEVDDAGILVLLEGVAHVAFDAGDGTATPAVALADGGVARFYRARGEPVPLAGPSRVRLAASGPQAFGEPARALFRDLQFFGGPLPPVTSVRFVSPRLWRATQGAVRHGRGCLRVQAAAQDAEARVQLAWRPPPGLADASLLRVALRAPAGTRVSLPGLGVDGQALEVRLASDAAPERLGAAEPGVATLEIPLPSHWYRQLSGEALRVDISVPGSATPAPESGTSPRSSVTRAWFDGVSLVLSASLQEALVLAGGVAGE